MMHNITEDAIIVSCTRSKLIRKQGFPAAQCAAGPHLEFPRTLHQGQIAEGCRQ